MQYIYLVYKLQFCTSCNLCSETSHVLTKIERNNFK
uniref:Uncharacterized protein n=1 Tax=Lepeophtheirus salmonis TaxID=72036 RepID=A0A0K2TRR0_LEPSM